MREFKILVVVVFFTLLVYVGVEPFAHSKMHAHVESHNFTYDGTADIKEAEDKVEKTQKSIEDITKRIQEIQSIEGSPEEDLVKAQKSLEKLKVTLAEAVEKVNVKKSFWANIAGIAKLDANVTNGEMVFGTCMACHNGAGINMGGVIPPSLDHVGSLYDKNYLIALIKDPAMASNVDHKYAMTMMHPMGSVAVMVTTDQDIADVVAYMMANKTGELTPKIAYEEACGRCHAVRYKKFTQLGDTPEFKNEQDALAHKIKVLDEQALVKAYMGKLPPDLSMMIRARSPHFMETFIENPQTQLAGTSMPRVGLTKESYEEVKAYLEEAGDPSKPAREAIGPWVLLFFVIFTVLAYLWKKSQWKDLH
jgi:ubiquinol-cytochrome c reductase cytochrome c1 subunit